MKYSLYEEGKKALDNEDNKEWINNITCLKVIENDYNIYVFKVIIENQNFIEKYYFSITSAIAYYFQVNLEKEIEKWNIYVVFESKEEVDWKIRLKIEQDKYAVRKIVWDNLGDKEIQNDDFLINRLFNLNLENKQVTEKSNDDDLLEVIKENDKILYNILRNTQLEEEQKVAVYLGGDIND